MRHPLVDRLLHGRRRRFGGAGWSSCVAALVAGSALWGSCSEQNFSSFGENRIAVVVGDFDDPTTVLRRLVVFHDQWTGIISSATWNPDWDWRSSALQVEDLLGEGGQLFAYEQVWVASGTRGLGSVVYNGVARDDALLVDNKVCDNLRTYVRRGGDVFVTDWAYDLVERCWPREITFLGDDEVPDAAQLGLDGTIIADVLESGLVDALGSDKLAVRYEFSNQTIITDVRNSVTVWLRGDAPWRTEAGVDRVQSDSPLLVSFRPAIGGGRVVVATFHVDAQSPAAMDRLIQIVLGPIEVGSAADPAPAVAP